MTRRELKVLLLLATSLVLFTVVKQTFQGLCVPDSAHDINKDKGDAPKAVNDRKTTRFVTPIDVATEIDVFETDDEAYTQLQKSSLQQRNRTSTDVFNRISIFKRYAERIKFHPKVDCQRLVENHVYDITNDTVYQLSKDIMKKEPRNEVPNATYLNISNCEDFRLDRGYIMDPLSETEVNFPLAFGLLVYKDPEQVDRLLRAIYRPHNVYCIHIDKSSDIEVRITIENIAGCFDNVHLADERIDVEWGYMSVLEAELSCMKTVSKYKFWKYYINLTGQEFPLKTNLEIVSILRTMQGANIVDGSKIRTQIKFSKRYEKAGPPPHGIVPIKGAVHVAVNPDFVNFCVTDQRARDFLMWLNKTDIPDESFFSSINYNPQLGIRGSFLGEREETPLKVFFLRYKNWQFGMEVFHRQCLGKYVRDICVLGLGDIRKAYNSVELFANKFNLDFEYLALDCLEAVLYMKTWRQFLVDEMIDTSYYEHSDFIKYKL